MPRGGASKNYFQFTKGKITEASPLTFPEDSMKDELNIDINFNGTIQRRKGLDYEGGFELEDAFNFYESVDPNVGAVTQSYLWENVGDLNIPSPVLVIRYGPTLLFYEAYSEPLSSARLGISLNIYPHNMPSDTTVSFAEAKGYLFVAGENFDPFYVYFEPQTGTFKKKNIFIKIRDMEGIDDNLPDDRRPTSLSGSHHYNLINQGWPYQKTNYKFVASDNEIKGTQISSVNAFRYLASRGNSLGESVYPSNSDKFLDYIDLDSMLGSYIVSRTRSSSLAPKGRVIIDAFKENRKDLAEEYSDRPDAKVTPWVPSNFPERSTDKRPSAIAFFQGHVLYSGLYDKDYNDKIYVSQSLVGVDRANKCHSVNDPTAEIESSPLDTDGGVIRIEGVDRILSLQIIGGYCLVLANNGVWALSSAGDMFTMNSVSISKLSNVGAVGANPVVAFEGGIFFWSQDGIYTVQLDPQFETLNVTNITEQTIQSAYVIIPDEKKALANPVVDKNNRKIYWFYNNIADDPSVNRMNRTLVFDLRTTAFYDYEFDISGNKPFVTTGFFKPAVTATSLIEPVVVGGTQVQVNGQDVVATITYTESSSEGSVLKLFTFEPSGNSFNATFSNMISRSFLDWVSWNNIGVNYDSFVETGYEHLGDTMRNKQASYVFCYFNRTEKNFVYNDQGGLEFDYPSSCFLQSRWDWTGSGGAGRWTSPQQVYRLGRRYIAAPGPFNYDFEVVETKNKVRGKGKALTIRFDSEPGKDFQLYGWAAEYTAGAAV